MAWGAILPGPPKTGASVDIPVSNDLITGIRKQPTLAGPGLSLASVVPAFAARTPPSARRCRPRS